MKENNTQYHRTYRTYTCPHGIGRTNRYRMYRFGQQYHADGQTNKESDSPKVVLYARESFHFPKQKAKPASKNPAMTKTIQFIYSGLTI